MLISSSHNRTQRPMKLAHGLHLAYCTNIHRGESWEETFHSLKHDTMAVKQQVAASEPYAIGLRLGAAAARELWISSARAATAGLEGTTAGGWHPPGSDEPHVDRDGNEAGLSRLHGKSWSGVIRTGSPMPMPSRCASPAPISITASTKSARPLPSASAA